MKNDANKNPREAPQGRRQLSPAKAGFQINIDVIQGWRASRLLLAILFHAFSVKTNNPDWGSRNPARHCSRFCTRTHKLY